MVALQYLQCYCYCQKRGKKGGGGRGEWEVGDCFYKSRYRHNNKSKYVQRAHYAPSIDLNALHVLIHLMFATSWWEKHWYYPCFTHAETEAQSDFPTIINDKWIGKIKPRQFSPRIYVVTTLISNGRVEHIYTLSTQQETMNDSLLSEYPGT